MPLGYYHDGMEKWSLIIFDSMNGHIVYWGHKHEARTKQLEALKKSMEHYTQLSWTFLQGEIPERVVDGAHLCTVAADMLTRQAGDPRISTTNNAHQTIREEIERHFVSQTMGRDNACADTTIPQVNKKKRKGVPCKTI
jgi:hypothetical protein